MRPVFGLLMTCRYLNYCFYNSAKMNSTRPQHSSLKKQVSMEFCVPKTEDCLLQNGQKKQGTSKDTEKNPTVNEGPVSPPRTPGRIL